MKHTNQYTDTQTVVGANRKTIKIIRYKTFSGAKLVDIMYT